MQYEIVQLESKIVVGVSVETSNSDPVMGSKISALWTELYQTGIHESIKNKVNPYAIGLYSDYSEDGGYTASAGNEVSKSENPELVTKIIPGGKYAKFSIHGNMVEAVKQAWGEIWKIELDRRFTGDFEEYLNSDWENADINIYIALN